MVILIGFFDICEDSACRNVEPWDNQSIMFHTGINRLRDTIPDAAVPEPYQAFPLHKMNPYILLLLDVELFLALWHKIPIFAAYAAAVQALKAPEQTTKASWSLVPLAPLPTLWSWLRSHDIEEIQMQITTAPNLRAVFLP
jgi:hypothetical protein